MEEKKPSLPQKALQQLHKRQVAGRLRSLPRAQPGIDFYSNDYLGLAQDPKLQREVLAQLEDLHQSGEKKLFGSTGSRLISGNQPIHQTVEQEAANFFQEEAALFFPSGYAANSGLLASVPQRNDLILLDAKAHASLKEGARLSMARKVTFAHNNRKDLKAKILHWQGKVEELYVVTESLFSMDGDFAPLQCLHALCHNQGAHLILDEAHSTGWYGPAGRGQVAHQGLQGQLLARVHTLGKAPGCAGAFVAGSQALIDYLVNFALPFIYTTAPPAAQLLAAQTHLRCFAAADEPRKKLQQAIDHYGQKAQILKDSPPKQGPIQIIRIPDNALLKATEEKLLAQGIQTKAIYSPTVPEGEECLRVCLHAFNSAKEIDLLLHTLQKIGLADRKN